MDPFAVLGVDPMMDLDPAMLERRYLELSRESHPDRHRSATPEEQTAVLARSAQLNDAYRLLIDPWRRATALLELRDPGVIDRTKNLGPMFLASAMELAEEVEDAAGSAADELAARLRTTIDQDLAAVGAAIGHEDYEAAATRLHQARYHRKALHDLNESK